MRILPFSLLNVAIVLLTLALWTQTQSAGQDLPPRLRRPAAMVVSTDGNWLYVANRDSGSLSIIDLKERRTAAEVPLGERLAHVTRVDAERLLAVDEARHEAILLCARGAKVEPLSRLKVSPYPVEACVTADGARAFISSLWSRRLTEVSLPGKEGGELSAARVMDLSYPPRKLLLTQEDSRLIVADAFIGRLGVVDVAAGQLLATRNFPAHNVRGLAVSADGRMLTVAHQMLNDLAHTVRNDIHWGMLLSNDLRWLPLNAVLDPQAELYAGAHMHPLGDPGRGGADPSDLAMTRDGLAVVSMGGANQVALGREQDFSLRRIAVGKRPTALALSPDEKFVYVANTFDDSIAVLDLESEENVATISLGPQPELTLAQRGELLFYDGRLSHDGWMSCHSCHTDGHTNGMLNDNFSDASFGAPKRVLSLLGVGDTGPFAWNGQVEQLETQIHNSIQKTMQRDDPTSETAIQELAAYLRTLAPPPNVDELRGTANPQAIARGKAVFQAQKCDRCHAGPTYTSPQAYDVGLVDSQGNREFNPPSLRGVGQRGPYFHDHRAATLEDVFQVHEHPEPSDLDEAAIADLAAFLRSL